MSNVNDSVELGKSDEQALITNKKRKKLLYIGGFIALLAVVGVIVALVVVLSGNEGDESETTTEPPTTSTIVPPTIPPTEPGIIETTTLEPVTTTEAVSTTTEPEIGTTPTTLEPTTTEPTDTEPTTTEPTTIEATTTEPTTIEATTTETTTAEPTTTEPPEDNTIDPNDVINGVYTPAGFDGTWSSDNEIFFRNSDGHLMLYDVDNDEEITLISNSSEILQQSSRLLQLSPDGSEVALAYNVESVYRYSFVGQYSTVNVENGQVTNIAPATLSSSDVKLQNFVWGPSGTSLAFVYLNNIYYQSALTSSPVQITTTGISDVVYNGIADWVYEEEVFLSSNALWFSADGSKLAYVTFDDNNVRIMKVPHFGVPGSVDHQYTQHNEIRYPKVGTTNPTVTVTLYDLQSGSSNSYSAPTNLDDPILKIVRFVTNDRIALIWTNRFQNTIKVVLCTRGQNSCDEIYEYSETNGWIDIIPLIFNEAGNSFITILPRAVNGVLYKQIVQVSSGADSNTAWTAVTRTNSPHAVLEILRWNSNNEIWYRAPHVNDPTEQHIYSLSSAGEVACFTCNIQREDGSDCLFNTGVLSSTGTRITINCAGPGVPQVFIYDINGASLIRRWNDNSEIALLAESRELPVLLRYSVPIVSGLPNAEVLIQAPADYQSRTNVPLLVYTYAGPDSAAFTKQWRIDWGSSLVSRWGIAVAYIDGRGSGRREAANTFALNRRLGTVEVEDQIIATRYLQENLSWLDASRTCIWGWSYGGYAASLALARGGDVFKCAMAVAPVVDWRYYDTIYTERYMSTPEENAEGYLSSTLLTQEVVEAYRDKSYFLIHGSADDNVHYQHAMLLSRLLQRQNVYFKQMSYTDEDHALGGVRTHLYAALEEFLEENLLS